MKEVAETLRKDPRFGPSILEEIKIFGVDDFTDSAVTVKARLKTVPIQQWIVGREYRRRLKKAFDARGIEIPFPHRSWPMRAADSPLEVMVRTPPSAPGDDRVQVSSSRVVEASAPNIARGPLILHRCALVTNLSIVARGRPTFSRFRADFSRPSAGHPPRTTTCRSNDMLSRMAIVVIDVQIPTRKRSIRPGCSVWFPSIWHRICPSSAG